MGIYIKEPRSEESQKLTEYLLDMGLLKGEKNPFNVVDWYVENAIALVVRDVNNDKIVAGVLARRHPVDCFAKHFHDDNGDVLFVAELASDSHEAVYLLYKQFLTNCIDNGNTIPNVIMFNRQKRKEKKLTVAPAIGLFHQIGKLWKR